MLQQVGTSTAWDAAPASGMSRTNSVPENFGSSSNGAAGQQPAALPTMFTVTTGDVITRTASGEGAVALELPVSSLAKFTHGCLPLCDINVPIYPGVTTFECHALISRMQGAALSGSCRLPLLRLTEAWIRAPMPLP